MRLKKQSMRQTVDAALTGRESEAFSEATREDIRRLRDKAKRVQVNDQPVFFRGARVHRS